MSTFCKYYKEVKQVSYDSGQTWENLDEYRKGDLYESDSVDCGGGITQYRWVNVSGQYTCVGTTKYQKTKKQQSTDGGNTWSDVSPIEYSTGAVIEYNSSDCGQSYSSQYLTFVATESGTFSFSGNDISYSLDSGTTWNTLASGANSPTVSSGNKIMWKATITPTGSRIGKFSSTKSFTVEGNVMSLLYGDNFVGQTSLSGKNYVFAFLFDSCSKLTSAENIVLPATTLAGYCYYFMFGHCTSLTKVPKLLATTLAVGCYCCMFAYCSSLTTVPSDMLPSTTLATNCYWEMFFYCTSLTTAPELPATTLQTNCYIWMFGGCNRLNYIKCLATNISATDCTDSWVSGVASSGTFVKASSMSSWTSGSNGIPNNWTIQNV